MVLGIPQSHVAARSAYQPPTEYRSGRVSATLMPSPEWPLLGHFGCFRVGVRGNLRTRRHICERFLTRPLAPRARRVGRFAYRQSRNSTRRHQPTIDQHRRHQAHDATSTEGIKPAPKARNIEARGKREARRPWLWTHEYMRPERPKYHPYDALSALDQIVLLLTRGDALRACPWLSYSAPSALCWFQNCAAFGAGGYFNARKFNHSGRETVCSIRLRHYRGVAGRVSRRLRGNRRT